MRFLTAFLSISEGDWELKGTPRMHQRPIGSLVSALQQLGAEIHYLGKEGYPPLKIIGKSLSGNSIEMDSSESSQFISAIMMIAPKIANQFTIHFKTPPVSLPYIKMTGKLMERLGFSVDVDEQKTVVKSFSKTEPRISRTQNSKPVYRTGRLKTWSTEQAGSKLT